MPCLHVRALLAVIHPGWRHLLEMHLFRAEKGRGECWTGTSNAVPSPAAMHGHPYCPHCSFSSLQHPLQKGCLTQTPHQAVWRPADLWAVTKIKFKAGILDDRFVWLWWKQCARGKEGSSHNPAFCHWYLCWKGNNLPWENKAFVRQLIYTATVVSAFSQFRKRNCC